MKKDINLQGFRVDLKSFQEALDYTFESIKEGKNIQIVTINPEMIQFGKKNSDFKKILDEAELIVPDGVGIKIAIKLKGINQEQIPGVDFSKELIKLSEKYNLKIGFLGAKQEVLDKMLEKFKEEFPNLNVVYAQNGYFNDKNTVLEEIKNAQPQILLTALGSPKQEEINYKLKEMLQGCATIGVGGSFDVFAGYVERAPKIWQKMGLEWLYRTIKQPQRFKRIFPTLPLFLFASIIDSVKK